MRLVSVESGQIRWSKSLTDSHTLGSRGELSILLSCVANNMANAFPDKRAMNSKSDKKSAKRSTGLGSKPRADDFSGFPASPINHAISENDNVQVNGFKPGQKLRLGDIRIAKPSR